jgi:hypothetical protein
MTFSVALACVLGACGEGTICFGVCDDVSQDNVIVSGNIIEAEPTVPADPADDLSIVAFVYTDLTAAALAAGPPFASADYTDSEAAVVAETGTEQDTFSVSRITSGDLTVIFLRDDTGDRRIDAGDLFAVLDDEDDSLVDVFNGRNVDVQDVTISFDVAPAGGVATAEDILVTTPAAG